MYVVKLGGSLLFSRYLRYWLQRIVTISATNNIIIVPGGGCFADQVRRTQQHWHFSDDAAHDMSILAMEQYTYLLRALQPALVPLTDWQYCNSSPPRSGAQILMPRCLLTDCDLEKSWRVSSDSLSLWVADRLQATNLYLIKSAALKPGQQYADILARKGMLDSYFPALFRRTTIPVFWCFAKDYNGFPAAVGSSTVILSKKKPAG